MDMCCTDKSDIALYHKGERCAMNNRISPAALLLLLSSLFFKMTLTELVSWLSNTITVTGSTY